MTLFTVAMPTKSATRLGGSPSEALDVRVARMTAHWKNTDNAVIYTVGQLLKSPLGDGRTLATVLVAGESFPIESVPMANGTVLALQPGFILSLSTLNVWGCIACHSAHGSGVYPSKRATVAGLESNEFYYNPKTKALFTISATCWGSYVKALGAATDKRWGQVPAPQRTTNETATHLKVIAEGKGK